ncbi:YczE/YyaS/YitT family protein [Halonatronum saccharophilum]|uniref:YczE/YyaS/YitT family protein n=1 Tax=Halonatronum saccharophilum TaxID=150060 RepID=UPI000482659E|nr:membrane protein [Halonatronum saccharophilum]
MDTNKKNYLMFFSGLFVMAFGNVLTIKANLGVAPWDVFHIGMTNYINLTIGQAGQLAGVLVLLIAFLIARVKPSFGTLLNVILCGIIIDLLMVYIPKPRGIALSYTYMLIGLVVFSIGAALYISGKCGTGPRDTLMVALDNIFKVNIGIVRSGIELTALLSGYFMGGPVGIGTIILALGTGPILKYSFDFIDVIRIKENYKLSERIN